MLAERIVSKVKKHTHRLDELCHKVAHNGTVQINCFSECDKKFGAIADASDLKKSFIFKTTIMLVT